MEECHTLDKGSVWQKIDLQKYMLVNDLYFQSSDFA